MPVQQRIISRREALASRVGSPTRKAYAAQVHKIMRQPAGHRVTISRSKVLHSPIGSAIRKAYAAQVHKITGKPRKSPRTYRGIPTQRRIKSMGTRVANMLAKQGGGSSSRSEAARKAWRTRRGH